MGAGRQAIDRSVMVHTQKYERFRKSNGESLVSISKTKTIALWAITGLTAAAFGAAGIAKIIGALDVMPLVSEMGLPAWVGRLIGPAELAGAVGLLFRQLSTIAVIGLAVIMGGAIYYYALYTPLSQALPAVLLLNLLHNYFHGQAKVSSTG